MKKISRLIACLLILQTQFTSAQSLQKFTLTSTAFQSEKIIPVKYTCDDANVSPPLAWTGAPANTKSFALIMDDPDAPMGNWVHWIVYNIPASVNSLKEKQNIADLKALNGTNSWEDKNYNGPCPDGSHRYVFQLYALDIILPAKEGLTKEELSELMKGHIIAQTTLTGVFRAE